jgi:hypothetical protein
MRFSPALLPPPWRQQSVSFFLSLFIIYPLWINRINTLVHASEDDGCTGDEPNYTHDNKRWGIDRLDREKKTHASGRPVRQIHDDSCAKTTDARDMNWISIEHEKKKTSHASSRSGEEDHSHPAGRWQWWRALPPKPPGSGAPHNKGVKFLSLRDSHLLCFNRIESDEQSTLLHARGRRMHGPDMRTQFHL